MTLDGGSRLGRYELVAPLGAGGMGEVWRARDPQLEREVAIKVLPPAVRQQPDRLARFEREARAVARLSHPNILAIHDFGRDGGITYAVMELLAGATLRQRLCDERLGWRRALEIAAAVAEAMAAAHGAGVVHRDLKPENVFLTTGGQVKVLDFGLARLAERLLEDAGADTAAATATAPGTLLGTVGYMAPEQVRGETADARSDVFALGCLLYEMLTGERAFAGATTAETLSAILRDTPSEPSALVPGLDPRVDPVVARCLAKPPAERFQSASDLAFALRAQLHRAPSGPPASDTSEDRPSIAVLPFANLSADPEQEYFCDGMAEEVINALVHVEGLRVVARTSAFAFKGQHRDLREIGRELGVGTVLEGSVRRAGDRVRVTAQLIDIADGFHRWSERFDRRLEDVFAIQDEIALAIVEGLEVPLLGGERAAVVRRPTADLGAHNAFLQGIYCWNQLSPEGYARSREHLEEAVRLDPRFADAHAWLAVWYHSQAIWGGLSPEEALPPGRRHTELAIALDPGNAMAHAVQGIIRFFFERQWDDGERRLRRAVELAPSLAEAHGNLAIARLVQERWEDALAGVRQVQRLDPLSPTFNSWAAAWLGLAGRLDEGLAEIDRVVAIHPAHWLPHHYRGELLLRAGRIEEARQESERAVELSSGAAISVFQLAGLCLQHGPWERGEELLERLLRQSGEGWVPPMFLAWGHVAKGDAEAALGFARQALAADDMWICFHRFVCPSLVPADERLEKLLEPALPPRRGPGG